MKSVDTVLISLLLNFNTYSSFLWCLLWLFWTDFCPWEWNYYWFLSSCIIDASDVNVLVSVLYENCLLNAWGNRKIPHPKNWFILSKSTIESSLQWWMFSKSFSTLWMCFFFIANRLYIGSNSSRFISFTME